MDEQTQDGGANKQAHDQPLGIVANLDRPQRANADADEYERSLARAKQRCVEIWIFGFAPSSSQVAITIRQQAPTIALESLTVTVRQATKRTRATAATMPADVGTTRPAINSKSPSAISGEDRCARRTSAASATATPIGTAAAVGELAASAPKSTPPRS